MIKLENYKGVKFWINKDSLIYASYNEDGTCFVKLREVEFLVKLKDYTEEELEELVNPVQYGEAPEIVDRIDHGDGPPQGFQESPTEETGSQFEDDFELTPEQREDALGADHPGL